MESPPIGSVGFLMELLLPSASGQQHFKHPEICPRRSGLTIICWLGISKLENMLASIVFLEIINFLETTDFREVIISCQLEIIYLE